jgi:hypothetical protein
MNLLNVLRAVRELLPPEATPPFAQFVTTIERLEGMRHRWPELQIRVLLAAKLEPGESKQSYLIPALHCIVYRDGDDVHAIKTTADYTK